MPIRFVEAYAISTGRKMEVPEHFIGHPKLGRDLALTPSQRDQAAELPEGEPTEEWTVKQLEQYARNHQVDLAGATRKVDILTAIEAAPETSEPTQDSVETPATGAKE